MKVQLFTVCVAHDEPDGTMIFGDGESLESQHLLDRGEVVQRHHEIEIVVRPRLLSEESVHWAAACFAGNTA